MNSIYNEIITLIQEYKDSTGLTPTKLYAGRIQCNNIAEWAYQMGYIEDLSSLIQEGKSRPEVAGLKLYEVNADNHLRCCR